MCTNLVTILAIALIDYIFIRIKAIRTLHARSLPTFGLSQRLVSPPMKDNNPSIDIIATKRITTDVFISLFKIRHGPVYKA